MTRNVLMSIDGCYLQETDSWGRPVRRIEDSRWVDPTRTKTKSAHPYSYDEFFLFGNRKIIEQDDVNGQYSDRLWQFWHDAYRPCSYSELWDEYVGKRYDQAGPSRLSTFFTQYHRIMYPEQWAWKRTDVVALAEGCNASNGYPYWVIWWREVPQT